MKKKVYIDFGVGTFYEHVKKNSIKGYYTIVIDKRISEPDNLAYEENKHFVDKRIIGDWINDYDIPKADIWSNISTFEHIPVNMIDKSIIGMIKKIKKDSEGYIWINLTDHFGGFEHYNPKSYGKEAGSPDKFKYINTIKSDKWKTIFAKYFDFTYEEKYLDNIKEYPSTAIFNNVRLKK